MNASNMPVDSVICFNEDLVLAYKMHGIVKSKNFFGHEIFIDKQFSVYQCLFMVKPNFSNRLLQIISKKLALGFWLKCFRNYIITVHNSDFEVNSPLKHWYNTTRGLLFLHSLRWWTMRARVQQINNVSSEWILMMAWFRAF